MSKKDNIRLTIIPEMIPYLMEKYDEYYNNTKSTTLKDVGEELNQLFTELFGVEYRFDESAYRKTYKNIKDGIDISLINNFSEEEVQRIARARNKLQYESNMVQAQKIEVNKKIREQAREDLIISKITNAIKELAPLKFPKQNTKQNNNTEKSGVLAFGDEHFGVSFEIKGIYGEVLNAYSPEIFENRMFDLLTQTIQIIKKEKLDKVYVFSLGDFCDGVLRTSQLMKLKYSVVDATVLYAEFISNWLNELSKHVKIEFQMVNGNHSELRMLGEPKGTFTDDNMGYIVAKMIQARLEKNPKFTFVSNPTGLIFAEISGYKFLGIHGEVKNMSNAIKEFSKTYNIIFDYLIGAHYHHARNETVGVNSEVINVPSIIGLDHYSLSLNKTSNPGATFLIIEKDKGKTCEYSIKL